MKSHRWSENEPRVEDLSGENWDDAIVNFLQHDGEARDLSGAQLSYADLTREDLRAANLSDTDLRFANLSQCDLRAANLTNSNLESADLRVADLRGANLLGARLSHAKVAGAIFDSETKMPIRKRTAIMSGMVYLESDIEDEKSEPENVDYES